MILILTDKHDAHADLVIDKLKKNSMSYFRFNLDVESLKKTFVSFDGLSWKIRIDDQLYSSNDFSCVWCRRPFVELTLEEQEDRCVDFKIWKNEWNKTFLGIYNTLKKLPWLNPLRKAYKGENKYYQMEVARAIGFQCPETLISNNKKTLEEFVQRHEKVLFKLMSQEIYDTGNGIFKGLYTNIISYEDLKMFQEFEENPIVLQKYIDKQYEVRYTKVGNEDFVCRIDSQASARSKYDWRRYDIPNTPYYKMEPPDDIKAKVNSMLKRLGLEYGAFDFIVTPKNEWFFLEINCMGQWLWIEQLTNLPISDGIVNWLKKNSNERR